MIAYRICERKGDKLLTLFHGLNGSRVLPIGIWLIAILKLVRDGSKKTAKEYLSGFHILKSLDECRDFAKKFRASRDLVIVSCEVKNLRKKEHSPYNVFLADEIKLIEVVEKLNIHE